MGKKEKYNWKDSNMALFGSDVEKKIKEASAETEEAWRECGQSPCLKIWRIEQFKVVEWPEAKYGKFHKGDSYIILHSYNRPEDEKKEGDENDPLCHDAYFWIGSESTQDEYGTAAYKTVELDTFLKDAAIQHREVENGESDDFLALFDNRVRYLKGGVDSGFNHVEPETYKARLLHIKGRRKNVVVVEKKVKPGNLNSGDAFILDKGTSLTAWYGEKCNKDEKARCASLMAEIKAERSEIEVETATVDQGSEEESFWEAFGGKADISEKSEDDGEVKAFEKVAFRLSDRKKEGKLVLKKEAEGSFARDVLDTDDVFIIDTGFKVYVWIGKAASADERKEAMRYAHQYISENDRPANLPVTRLVEGQRCPAFDAVFEKGLADKAKEALEDPDTKAKLDKLKKKAKKKKCVIQ